MMKKITYLFLAAMLSLSTLTSVYAKNDAFITFDGAAGDFVHADTDIGIFDNFENIYPGETRTAKLTLKNTDDRKLKFWLSSEQLDDFSANQGIAYTLDFLIDGQSIFSGDIGGEEDVGMDQIGDRILITELEKGESAVLEIVLTTDGDSMDNSYQGALGEMKYKITVEYDNPTVEVQTIVKDKIVEKERVVYDTVGTGDNTSIVVFVALITCSLVGIGFVAFGNKKGKDKHENKK